MVSEPAPATDQDLGPRGATAPGTVSPASLRRLADAVYGLLRDDLVRQRERRGGGGARWR